MLNNFQGMFFHNFLFSPDIQGHNIAKKMFENVWVIVGGVLYLHVRVSFLVSPLLTNTSLDDRLS